MPTGPPHGDLLALPTRELIKGPRGESLSNVSVSSDEDEVVWAAIQRGWEQRRVVGFEKVGGVPEELAVKSDSLVDEVVASLRANPEVLFEVLQVVQTDLVGGPWFETSARSLSRSVAAEAARDAHAAAPAHVRQGLKGRVICALVLVEDDLWCRVVVQQAGATMVEHVSGPLEALKDATDAALISLGWQLCG